MIVMDIDTGKVVACLPIGQGVDAIRFDPKRQLVFSANGDGTLTIVHEESPDSYSVLDNLETQRAAPTMELDPRTHRVHLVTAELGPQAGTYPSRSTSVSLDNSRNIHAVCIRTITTFLTDRVGVVVRDDRLSVDVRLRRQHLWR